MGALDEAFTGLGRLHRKKSAALKQQDLLSRVEWWRIIGYVAKRSALAAARADLADAEQEMDAYGWWPHIIR